MSNRVVLEMDEDERPVVLPVDVLQHISTTYATLGDMEENVSRKQDWFDVASCIAAQIEDYV